MPRLLRPLGALFLVVAAVSLARGQEGFDWSLWRALPIHSEGRPQPLDTLARETLGCIFPGAILRDPTTGAKLAPVEAYLALVLEWRGWDHPDHRHLERLEDWNLLYGHLQQADRWDQALALRVDSLVLREALGLAKEKTSISPQALAAVKVEDAHTDRQVPFLTWARTLRSRAEAGESLAAWETAGIDLADKLQRYQELRMGRGLAIVPVRRGDERAWVTIGQLLVTPLDSAIDPAGDLRKCQELWKDVERSYRERDVAAFHRSSRLLAEQLRRFGGDFAEYPSPRALALEVAYHRWQPFRTGWLLLTAAGAAFLAVHAGRLRRPFRWIAWACYGGGTLAAIAGLGLRSYLLGQPPLTNLFESLVSASLGITLGGLLLERWTKTRAILPIAAIAAAILMGLAEAHPTLCDRSLRIAETMLSQRFWLMAHASAMALAAAALALAAGIANTTLGCSLCGRDAPDLVRALHRSTIRILHLGALLLAAGLLLGAAWSDATWGRWWHWESKEGATLAALLGYLALLAAWRARLVRARGTAAWACVCFALLAEAWLSPLPGRHRFGTGTGGELVLAAAIVGQLLFVVLAWLVAQRQYEQFPRRALQAPDWPANRKGHATARAA